MSSELIIIAHNIRSTHNIGSLLRTADGLGIQKIYFTGYTPYPQHDNDERLPHLAAKIHTQISKTALGAELTVDWEHIEDIATVLKRLRNKNVTIAALEQTKESVMLPEFKSPEKLALLLGSEVTGIDNALLAKADVAIEIPMQGQKESYNVIEATTMAMYHCRFVA